MFTIANKAMTKMKSWSILIALLIGAFVASTVIMVLLFDLTDYGISFAAIGATIFMVFTTSGNSHSIKIKTLFGAYGIAGCISYIAIAVGRGNKIIGALAILLAIGMMIMLKWVHAPAIGFVLSFILNQFRVSIIVAVLFCIFSLIIIAKAIKSLVMNPSRYHIKIDSNKVEFKFKSKDNSRFMGLRKEYESY
jgi:hypothetical protein